MAEGYENRESEDLNEENIANEYSQLQVTDPVDLESTNIEENPVEAQSVSSQEVEAAPDGWKNTWELAKAADVSSKSVSTVVNEYRTTHPEWFGVFKSRGKQTTEHFHPELVSVVEEHFAKLVPPPEGWLTKKVISRELKRHESVIIDLGADVLKEHPEWAVMYKGGNGRLAEHYSPELIAIIKERLDAYKEPSEGWTSLAALSREIDVDYAALKRTAKRLAKGLPGESIKTFRPAKGRATEYYSPELRALIEEQLATGFKPPEGWLANGAAKDEIGGISGPNLARLAEKHRQNNPEWFAEYGYPGQKYEYYSPELVEALRSEIGGFERAPEGWQTVDTIAKSLGVAHRTVANIIDTHASEYEGSVQEYRDNINRKLKYIAPDLAAFVTEQLQSRELAPDGWRTNQSVIEELGIAQTTAQRIANEYREEHPEYFANYMLDTSSKVIEHYSPELVAIIKERIAEVDPAPAGWRVALNIAEELGVSDTTIRKKADEYRTAHPEWFAIYKGNRNLEHYAPELVDILLSEHNEYERTPSGWLTIPGLAKKLAAGEGTVKRLVNDLREQHPEDFKMYRPRIGRPIEHCSPQIIEIVADTLAERDTLSLEAEALDQTKRDFESWVKNTKKSDSVESESIKKLVDLFGAGSVVDILYQFHPEYRDLPLPYVRSMLADYLGEFMAPRGGFSLETIRESADYLRDPNLRTSLTTIVKKDCLAFYNKVKQTHVVEDDLSIVELYISNLRTKTSDIQSEDLETVIADVEMYYQTLFTEIEKPDQLRDGLAAGRDFPDINQRINVQEINQKKKMLIADEMGLGKSASAIISKETLGVKLAVVLAPSNVVDTWRGYLSDQPPTEDGRSKGYFKEGQAPRVLVVDSLDDLDFSADSYDYILMSQERLNDDYTSALGALNYDMLIVDEVHKVKNLSAGKRAGHVVELAGNLEGEDQYLALLSGTPVPNKVGDVAMLLKLLHPDRFEEVSDQELVSQVVNGDILDIRTLLEDRMQMKSLTESVEMPKLQERERKIQLSEIEKSFYEVLLEEDELTASEKMQLMRKFILNPASLDASPNLVGSKSQEVNEALNDAFDTSDKIVMFVNGYVEDVIRGDHTIFDNMQLPDDVEVVTIHGEVPAGRRQEIQAELAQEGKRMLLAVSGQTADTGVDFSEADEVFFYNEPWTIYDKKQELSRVYRFGVKHDIKSTTFYAEGTIEEGIHKYIEAKYQAVEKLLRGVPLSEIEAKLVMEDEKQDGANLEVNPELAEYYFSSWDRMMKIYGHVKEIGEEEFVEFLSDWGSDYAEAYSDLGSRSYQANASRLAGTLIDQFRTQRGQSATSTRVLDVASGPEMLKKHISDEMAPNVYSVDINQHHFEAEGSPLRALGSFKDLPIANESMDYVNMSMALHYSRFTPSRVNDKNRYERLEIIQEMNRVLTPGGRAVLSLMYSLDFKNQAAFEKVIAKCGFEIVDEFSGDATSGDVFKARVITLQKNADCEQDTQALVSAIGSVNLQGLKFAKVDAKLKDSRKIATNFDLDGQQINANLNATDQQVYSEEQGLTQDLEALRDMYGEIKAIPEEVLVNSGYSRVYNGKSYILFKKLTTASGAVVVR